jgi:hypothetical protein
MKRELAPDNQQYMILNHTLPFGNVHQENEQPRESSSLALDSEECQKERNGKVGAERAETLHHLYIASQL